MKREEIERVEQRARSYWYEDGLTEIAAGCLFILVGLLFFVEATAAPGSLPAGFSSLGLVILVFVGVWTTRYVVNAVKTRLTYPRTGYVAYRRVPRVRRFITAAVALMLAAVVAALLRLSPTPLEWVPLLDGVVIGGFLLYMGHTLGLARFYALAVLSVLVGMAASLGGLGETLGSAAYFSAMGAGLIASGGLTLRSYLLQTQPRTDG